MRLLVTLAVTGLLTKSTKTCSYCSLMLRVVINKEFALFKFCCSDFKRVSDFLNDYYSDSMALS